ncbi:MAG: glycosyltransferase, partial [Brevefilum sp.]|nr:glycosyltransferase [Brevefilum sp.]
PNALWIASMGRLDPLKHFEWLLQIIAKLGDKHSNIHLVLIGDGPERTRLETLAEGLDLTGNVTFTGEVPMASTWLKAMDIFTFPSVDEGMPNVILEAAAAGLPIVAWRLPFYQELLTNAHTALLVDPYNQNQMLAALNTLIDSPELRRSLGQAARHHILTSFSLERYVNEMTHVYETVLGERT